MTSDGKDGYFSVPFEYHMIYNPPPVTRPSPLYVGMDIDYLKS